MFYLSPNFYIPCPGNLIDQHPFRMGDKMAWFDNGLSLITEGEGG
jgi:hypothetical protein